MMATFSMASMTDIIFLLLIFFMITSTFVFPTALEVNLPQSTIQTALKPSTRVFIDRERNLYASFGAEEPQPMQQDALLAFLQLAQQQAAPGEDFIAIYADEEVLDMGAKNNLKMVLATRPTTTQKARKQ